MTTLALPSLTRKNVTQCSLSLVANTQAFESPLNKTVQTGELPGARWTLAITWQNLNSPDARIVKAWIVKLRGMAGRFNAGDLSHKTPSGTALGAPLVMGANQSGRTLVTDGWTPNQAALLLPGDYIGVGGELKIITDVAASDGTGHATLLFEPPLRSVPADNSPVLLNLPTCVFRLSDDAQDKVNFDPDRHPSVTVNAVEVF